MASGRPDYTFEINKIAPTELTDSTGAAGRLVGGGLKVVIMGEAGGDMWETYTSPTAAAILDISTPTATLGMILDNNRITYTWDGSVWTSRGDPGIPLGVSRISIKDSTHALAGGWASTTDYAFSEWNGTSWTPNTKPDVEIGITGIFQYSTSDAVAVARGRWSTSLGYFYSWDGSTWTKEKTTGEAVSCVHRIAADHGLATGYAGTIWEYDGTDWDTTHSVTSTQLNDVKSLDSTHAFAVGSGGKIYSFDGATWSAETSPTSVGLSGVFYEDATTAFACGLDGVILAWDGSDWTMSESPTTKALYDCDGFSTDLGFIVGADGVVLKFASGTSYIPLKATTEGYLKTKAQ